MVSKNRFLTVFLSVFVLFLLLATQTVSAQTPNEKEQDTQINSTETSQESKVEEIRIVDPDKFPRKGNIVGRIILAPFRAAAPKVNEGVTYFEKRYLNSGQNNLSNPHVKPLFGGLGDGTGIGGGVALSTGDSISSNFKLFSSFHLTTRRYLDTSAGFQIDPTGNSSKFFNLSFQARYRLRPEEDFWGTGPFSLEGQRSTYYLQERGANLSVTFKLPYDLNFNVGTDYSSNRVFEGKDSRFAATQEVFRFLPGLEEGGAALLGTFASIQLEKRDNPNYARSGAFIHFGVTSNDSVGRGDFGYINYLFDGRGYIPLGNKRRVLAFRLYGNFNDPKGNSEIPFFRLARLGDIHTLRGYDTYRFHARNAISSNLEYRYQIGRWIDAFLFTDAGQVFNNRSELKFSNVHVTYGGGIQFRSEKKVFLKIYVGKTGEGARLFFNFGPTF